MSYFHLQLIRSQFHLVALILYAETLLVFRSSNIVWICVSVDWLIKWMQNFRNWNQFLVGNEWKTSNAIRWYIDFHNSVSFLNNVALLRGLQLKNWLQLNCKVFFYQMMANEKKNSLKNATELWSEFSPIFRCASWCWFLFFFPYGFNTSFSVVWIFRCV